MEMLQHHTNLVTVKPPPVQPELSRCTRMCQRILWSNLLRYHGEAENPRMTIGVQSTNEERKCATRHNVFTLPPQDQPYVPTAQGPLNGKRATAAYIIQLTKMDMQMQLHFNNRYQIKLSQHIPIDLGYFLLLHPKGLDGPCCHGYARDHRRGRGRGHRGFAVARPQRDFFFLENMGKQ